MRIRLGVVIGVLILLRAAVAIEAHHAFAAAFDENKPINLEGTVTKVELINPHSWIWVDVKGRDGKVVNWGIEGGPPNSLFRNGITKTSLPVGAVIRIVGYQAMTGEPRGVGAFLTYPDGRKVLMGGSAPGATAAPAGR
ncbi:MAG: hypothetical protein A3F70_05120 [Acidobacteria bacterium RIFCSPLOWO2_12_FULL_67_14]|nr:MAG: hypothetical protein A3H29_02460 [Acidobacteria bacterium RIFCSPLOWO2_02_FULL_67_21]OFW37833.1 MAG: hypothetical protein A3F70_05120 [Acidobacteria bacterium RIFCSPLOWO2_12_FULL_67_14]